jgi:hypothetical protein
MQFTDNIQIFQIIRDIIYERTQALKFQFKTEPISIKFNHRFARNQEPEKKLN